MTESAKPILEGVNVTLRPLTAADADLMFAALAEPVSNRLTGTHATHSLADVRRHCAMIEKAQDRWDYGIVAGGRLVGEAVLNHVDLHNRCASFRIAIWQPGQRDKGLGTEATSLLADFGFRALGLNRIELEVYAFNPRAIRVYEKVGFKLEGTRRQALIWGDEMVDAHIMGLLRSEYRAVQV